MTNVVLTNAVIEAACKKPPEKGKTAYLRDAKLPGLGVRIHPSGKGSFFVYLPGGAKPKLGSPFFGRPGPEALEEARREAARRIRERIERVSNVPRSVVVRDAKRDSIEGLVSDYLKQRLEPRVTWKTFKISQSRFQ